MSFKKPPVTSGYDNPVTVDVNDEDGVVPQSPNAIQIKMDPLNEKIQAIVKDSEQNNKIFYNSAISLKPPTGQTSLATSSYDLVQNSEEESPNFIARIVLLCRTTISNFGKDNEKLIKKTVLAILTVAYFVYFGFAIAYSWENEQNYCQGIGFLLILTVFAVTGVLYFCVLKRFCGELLDEVSTAVSKFFGKIWSIRFISWIVYVLIVAAIVTFLVVDTANNRRRLVSAAGTLILILIGFIFSKYPGKIIWRQVLWGLALQFVFALLILRWDVGQQIFQCLGDKISEFLNFTDLGSSFVFDYLVTGKLKGWNVSQINETFNDTIPFDGSLPMQIGIFGFKVLPVIFFFSFCISILYYYGIMQWIVTKLGWLLQVTIGTTAAESINAAANIFIGQTEAPLIIQPFLPAMTKSELHAVMTGGFATIAGGVLAAYINIGVSASHLLSASVMSAPAALGFSKLFYPESETSQTTADDIKLEKGPERNALEAAANGASNAIGLVANIVANLIAFIAFIGFLNFLVKWFATLIGYDYVTFEWLLSQLFIPLAYIMGVEWDQCDEVARLIGLKTVVNEFVAYAELSAMIKRKELSPRSQAIATYALCGFSNISSIGIQLGGLGAMAPERKSDLAEIGVRALIAGSIACFLTACIAGTLIDN